ncbi:hypothetical protein [Moraxella sp. ZY210820]|uniref:hypothetical protein n=1 Tax=unclassified Moraxella TaxID=2685852 RepID=UPI0027312A47|nr:hypothetical protein [Moraxella sp. ZY210820]WLF83638.1 hypothetical protein LU301_10340 [Moraxella sp. ZY210820]
MNNKQITQQLEQHGWQYDGVGTVALFSLCGGFIGGVVVAIAMGIFSIITGIVEMLINLHFNVNIVEIILSIFAPVVFGLIGLFLGFIPALFTGLYCAWRKVMIVDLLSYVRLYKIGFLSTSACCLFMFPVRDSIIGSIFICFVFGLVGGISATICGKLFLPKLQDLSMQFYQNSSLGDKT